MGSELILDLASGQGPWALLVFYLLWRDVQKDDATRIALNRNTEVLIEMATLVRERMRGRDGS